MVSNVEDVVEKEETIMDDSDGERVLRVALDG